MSFMYLAVEDELSEAVGVRIIRETLGCDIAVQVLRKGGFGYLKSKLRSFAEMSRHYAVLMITDLDMEVCASSLKATWFVGIEQPEKFVFRVAVREIESWLLADTHQLAGFLGVQEAVIPRDPDSVNDPKASLIQIARKAKRELRDDIVPDRGVKAKQGLGYNKALCPFVATNWNIQHAAKNSESLRRACYRVAELADRI